MTGEVPIPQGPIQSEHTEKQKLIGEMASVLEKAGFEKTYEPDRARQQRVLNDLPENIVEVLYADFLANYKYKEGYEKSHSGKIGTDRGENMLFGRLFEILVEYDPEFESQNPVAGEVLALIHDPFRFGMDKIGYIRNPDTVTVAIDEQSGKLVITSVGDAKTAKLDYRAWQQFSQGGFRYSLATAVETLDDELNFATLGLIELDRLKKANPDTFSISVSDNIKQIVIIPANRDMSNVENLVRTDSFNTHAKLKAAIDTFTNDVTFKKAAFSIAEVNALKDTFAKKISERYGVPLDKLLE